MVIVGLVSVAQGAQGRAAGAAPIIAEGTLEPQSHLFGDTLVARIDVTLDRRLVDPHRIQIESSFAPYTPGGETVTRRDAGETTYLRFQTILRCLQEACLPGAEQKRFAFPRARITSAAPGSRGGGRALVVAWPAVHVFSRLDASAARDLRSQPPFRVDVTTLPQVTYRIPPGVVLALLAAGALALLVAAAMLVFRAFPGVLRSLRGTRPRRLLPLERALALMDRTIAEGGPAEQRRALELLADELARSRGNGLVEDARELAWSESPPSVTAIQTLGSRVRTLIDQGAESDPA
jgi:hypothetical protein